MFSFLKGGKVNLTVTLDKPCYFPGDTIKAIVSYQSEKEFKAKEGRVVFLYREEFEYERETREWENDHYETRRNNTWGKDERELNKQVFLHETVLSGGAAQTFEFAVPLPPNAPPTWDGGRIVRIHWIVKATLSPKMGLDTNTEMLVPVMVAPPGNAAQAGEYGYSSKPDDTELALALPGKEFVAGEHIQGQLMIRPKKNFDAEVQMELTRQEEVRNVGELNFAGEVAQAVLQGNSTSFTNHPRQYEDKQTVKLVGKTKFQAGQAQAFPFNITIPNPVPATGQTPHAMVTWKLKGVLGKGLLHGSYTVEDEILVYTGRAA